MHIEVWFDLVCPFSYIGRQHFLAALQRFEHREQVEVIWRSFEVDPDAPSAQQADMTAAMMARYGLERQATLELIDKLQAMADASGIVMKLKSALPAKSFAAHRLLYFASEHGLQAEAIDCLMKAHFAQGQDLGHPETVVKLLAGLGLSEQELSEAYVTDAYLHEASADEHEAWNMGVRHTPYFVLDKKHAFAGALPTDIFLQILQEAHQGKYPAFAQV